MEPENLAETWSAFRAPHVFGPLTEAETAAHHEARNQLIVHYTPLVQMIASKVGSGLPSTVDRNDLVQYGIFGLIQVLSSYDPERGVQFSTFATPRIHGQIIDELRKIDPVSRTIRSKARDVERVKTELQVELNREPTNTEVANQLGITIHELWDLQTEVHTALLSSLDDDLNGNSEDDGAGYLSKSLSDMGANPEDLFGATVEITDLMASAISTLEERHKQILVLYYLEEMTLADIGKVLGVTESRVCQLQGKVLASLREALGQGVLSAA